MRGMRLESPITMADRSSTLGEQLRASRTLGQRIEAERRRLGWSQQKVARHLGVSQTTISHWVHDNKDRLPSDEKIEALAEWLPNITADEIRAEKYGIVPPVVAISQLLDGQREMNERLDRMEERQDRVEAEVRGGIAKRRPRRPKAPPETAPPEFKSEAPPAQDPPS